MKCIFTTKKGVQIKGKNDKLSWSSLTQFTDLFRFTAAVIADKFTIEVFPALATGKRYG